MGQRSSSGTASEREPADTASEESPPRGVLLIGEGGSGKSTLLKNILGKEVKRYISVTKSSRFNSVVVNIDGVPIKIYDVLKVSDGGAEEHLQAIKDLLQSDTIVLVILCVKIERMQDGLVALCMDYNRIGVNWERTVIALTFADCLYVPNEKRNPSQIISGCFNHAVTEWKFRLQTLLSEQVGVKQEVAEKIPVYPTTCYDEALPNGKSWLAPLLAAIMKMLDTTSSNPETPQDGLQPGAASQELQNGEPVKHYILTASFETQQGEIRSGAVLPELQMGSANFGEPVLLCTSSTTLDIPPIASGGTGTVSEECAALWQSVKEIFTEMPTPCPIFGILVIGETGSGKSTLINNLLGKEVARVGHTMQSETFKIMCHSPTVEGVGVHVYDTPGLDHSTDDQYEFSDLRMMQQIIARGKIHLVLYCFRMTETKMRRGLIHALQEYHKIGLPWQHTIMALTFADCVPKFDTRLPAVKKMLKEELPPRALLNPEDVESIRICPTTGRLDQPLPNGEKWFPTFGQEVKAILSKYTGHVAT